MRKKNSRPVRELSDFDAGISEINENPSTASVPDIKHAVHVSPPPKEAKRMWLKSINLSKVSLFIASLYLFMLAITLMKDGAGGVGPLIQDIFSITNPANSLGFGWLSAYLLMSGSPVAASALTFYDTNLINELSAFAMITGSRLGASFIVLFIGFIYVLRGRDRATSLSMGLLSLSVTFTTYLPSYFLGTFILGSGLANSLVIQSGVLLQGFFDRGIYPVSNLAAGYFPDWVIFIFGLGIIMLSFSLFDKCLPQMALKESQVGKTSRLVYHPLVMFVVGASITLISMSVTLSLSILVPLSNRGFIRRENVIPYILGANITTFIDTMFAAALLENPAASTIVLVSIFSTAAVSIAILLTAFHPYQHLSLKFVDMVTSTNRNMIIFMITIFIIPLILIGYS